MRADEAEANPSHAHRCGPRRPRRLVAAAKAGEVRDDVPSDELAGY